MLLDIIILEVLFIMYCNKFVPWCIAAATLFFLSIRTDLQSERIVLLWVRTRINQAGLSAHKISVHSLSKSPHQSKQT